MIPTILSLFKDARFIHIYRNGISVIDSLYKKERPKYIKMFPDDNQFMQVCAKYWVECISEIDFQDKMRSLSKTNILYQFSYEELCSTPQKQIAELASFIGCSETDFSYDYSEVSSTNYKVGNYSSEKRWEPVLKTILPTMIEKGYR
jgi:hypothetical protein